MKRSTARCGALSKGDNLTPLGTYSAITSRPGGMTAGLTRANFPRGRARVTATVYCNTCYALLGYSRAEGISGVPFAQLSDSAALQAAGHATTRTGS